MNQQLSNLIKLLKTTINLVTDRDIDNMKDLEAFYETEIKEMHQNLEDYLSV